MLTKKLTKKQMTINRKRLTTALRSGAYIQGKGKLFDPDKGTYCCMGVAQDMVEGSAHAHALTFHPGRKAMDHFGFTPHQCSILATMNDGAHSFNEIANHIDTMSFMEGYAHAP